MRHWEMKIGWKHILAILASFAAFVPQSRALVCYRCLAPDSISLSRRDSNDSKYEFCSKFDGSSKFYKDCPTSTFCMKKSVSYKLPDGRTMTTAERDCAHQTKVDPEWNPTERRWVSEKSTVPDAYSEGCFPGENRQTPNGPSRNCYCSSNYCNASSPMVDSRYLSRLLVILMFAHWNVLGR